MRTYTVGVWCLLLIAGLLGCTAPESEPAVVHPEQSPQSKSVPQGASKSWEVLVPAERDPRWAEARCNDGTPSGVSLRRNADSSTWVIRLQGGFFCNDASHPCSEQPARLITGPSFEGRRLADGETWQSGEQHGLYSTNAERNPKLYEANQAVLHYCSSDFWLGESTEKRATSGDPQGWYFSGRKVLRAGLEVLELAGLASEQQETRILLVGVSAGGLGLAANLDLVREVWPEATKQGRVHAVLDAGWIPDIDPPAETLADKWGSPLKACVARQADLGRPAVDCMRGPLWYPHWAEGPVPLLVQQSGLDRSQTRVYGVESAEEQRRWRSTLRESLAGVDWVFSAARPYHTLTTDPRAARGAPGQRFMDVFDAFWANESPRRVFVRYDEAP